MASLWQIFILFTRVAMFSWGGGPASLALMQRETTSAGWVTVDEFADAVAVGNALPGPIAAKVAVFVGYKLAGIPGAIAAATGTVIPTTLLMLLIIVAFYNIKDSKTVQAMLRAVRPAIVGLLLWTAYDMAYTVWGIKRLGWHNAVLYGWDKGLIMLTTFGILTFTKINPVYIVIATALLGFILYR